MIKKKAGWLSSLAAGRQAEFMCSWLALSLVPGVSGELSEGPRDLHVLLSLWISSGTFRSLEPTSKASHG